MNTGELIAAETERKAAALALAGRALTAYSSAMKIAGDAARKIAGLQGSEPQGGDLSRVMTRVIRDDALYGILTAGEAAVDHDTYREQQDPDA